MPIPLKLGFWGGFRGLYPLHWECRGHFIDVDELAALWPFFCGFSSFCIIDFLPNDDYLVYLHLKIIRYGKGYPCAFTA